MNGIRYLQKKSSQTCILLSIPEIILKMYEYELAAVMAVAAAVVVVVVIVVSQYSITSLFLFPETFPKYSKFNPCHHQI
jgi:hypothetical protein